MNGLNLHRKDTSNSGKKALVFVKSSFDDNNVSQLNVERPWFSEPEGFIWPNHDTGRILPPKSKMNITNSSSNRLEKLPGVEPQTGPKIIKSILKSCSTKKAKTLKGVIITKSNTSSPPTKETKMIQFPKDIQLQLEN
ncbi:hypothetical protein Tco_1210055 [Tanacetum coccineum]